jgi:hypothetical protein
VHFSWFCPVSRCSRQKSLFFHPPSSSTRSFLISNPYIDKIYWFHFLQPISPFILYKKKENNVSTLVFDCCLHCNRFRFRPCSNQPFQDKIEKDIGYHLVLTSFPLSGWLLPCFVCCWGPFLSLFCYRVMYKMLSSRLVEVRQKTETGWVHNEIIVSIFWCKNIKKNGKAVVCIAIAFDSDHAAINPLRTR